MGQVYVRKPYKFAPIAMTQLITAFPLKNQIFMAP